MLHPERWTKYNLEDVDVDGHAERQSALDFLTELRKRKEADANDTFLAQLPRAPSSRSSERPIVVDEMDEVEASNHAPKQRVYSLSDYGTIRVMEPCEVGDGRPHQLKKPKPKTKTAAEKDNTTTRLKLSHLHISDDSEDSDFGTGPHSPEKRQKITETKASSKSPSSRKGHRPRKTTDLSVSEVIEDGTPDSASGLEPTIVEAQDDDMATVISQHLSGTQLEDEEGSLSP